MSDGLFAVIVETKHFQRWQMWLGLLCSSQLLLYKPSALQHRLSRSAGWHQHLNQACKWANEVLPSLLSAQQQEVSAALDTPRYRGSCVVCGEAGSDRIGRSGLVRRAEPRCSPERQEWGNMFLNVWELMASAWAGENMPSGDELLGFSLQRWNICFRNILNTFYIFKLHLKSDSWEEI